MHFLIDADSPIYKAGCGNETRWYTVTDPEGFVVDDFQYKKDALVWMEEDGGTYELEKHKTAGPLKHSISNLRRIMNKIVKHEQCDTYAVYIGGKDNFRYDVYPEYKAQRDPLSKPLHEPQLREYLKKSWGAIVVDGEEVDDRVSILQEEPNTCIVSIDKDLDNTAGWHYNYDKETMYHISQEQADLNFYRQLITGDKSTDNIPGLPRHGKVAAQKILPEWLPIEEMCAVVWYRYSELEFDQDYFVMNGQLLWMRREDNEMWQPPIELA